MRWQRVPPTEKRGRTQTSTVTVAVLREPRFAEVEINDRDLEIRYTKDSGPGGQHKNKTESCVVITHIPTNITVKCSENRDQRKNKTLALKVLGARILALKESEVQQKRNAKRRSQIGVGDRSEKVRTIQEQNNKVIDHRTNKKVSFKKYLKGYIEELH